MSVCLFVLKEMLPPLQWLSYLTVNKWNEVINSILKNCLFMKFADKNMTSFAQN